MERTTSRARRGPSRAASVTDRAPAAAARPGPLSELQARADASPPVRALAALRGQAVQRIKIGTQVLRDDAEIKARSGEVSSAVREYHRQAEAAGADASPEQAAVVALGYAAARKAVVAEMNTRIPAESTWKDTRHTRYDSMESFARVVLNDLSGQWAAGQNLPVAPVELQPPDRIAWPLLPAKWVDDASASIVGLGSQIQQLAPELATLDPDALWTHVEAALNEAGFDESNLATTASSTGHAEGEVRHGIDARYNNTPQRRKDEAAYRAVKDWLKAALGNVPHTFKAELGVGIAKYKAQAQREDKNQEHGMTGKT